MKQQLKGEKQKTEQKGTVQREDLGSESLAAVNTLNTSLSRQPTGCSSLKIAVTQAPLNTLYIKQGGVKCNSQDITTIQTQAVKNN